MTSTMSELLKKQQEMEKQLEIRRLEGNVLVEVNNSHVGDSDAALITFLKERKDVVQSLKQILNLIEI